MAFLLTFSGGGSATYKDAVRVASTANLALSGSTPLTIDGVTLADKERVLLKDQSTGSQNGVYEVSISGGSYSLARAKDADTDKEVLPGMLVPVAEGSTHADKIFQLLTNAPIVVGTTALVFSDVLIGLANKADRDLQNLTLAGTTEQVLALGAGNSPYWATEGVKTGYPAGTVIVGRLKPAGLTGADNTIVGSGTIGNSITSSNGNILIGTNAAPNVVTVTQNFNTVIGSYAAPNLTGRQNVIVGGNAAPTLTGGVFNVIVGQNADVTGGSGRSVAIGLSAWATANYGVAIGADTRADDSSVALGAGSSTASQTNVVAIGSSTAQVNTMYLGRGGATQTAANAVTIMTMRASGTNTDLSAGTLTLAGSRSTGDKAGGDVIISTAPAGSSGSTLNNHVERVRVTADGNVGIGTATPAQKLDVNGGLKFAGGLTVKRHATAVDYTATVDDYYIAVTDTSALRTITLPAAASAGEGKVLVIKDESGAAATNTIVIDGDGAETIDGAATYVMAVNRESVTLVCDGTGWQII